MIPIIYYKNIYLATTAATATAPEARNTATVTEIYETTTVTPTS